MLLVTAIDIALGSAASPPISGDKPLLVGLPLLRTRLRDLRQPRAEHKLGFVESAVCRQSCVRHPAGAGRAHQHLRARRDLQVSVYHLPTGAVRGALSRVGLVRMLLRHVAHVVDVARSDGLVISLRGSHPAVGALSVLALGRLCLEVSGTPRRKHGVLDALDVVSLEKPEHESEARVRRRRVRDKVDSDSVVSEDDDELRHAVSSVV
mmetsp:Transcript_8512/g.21147  ORF Transcript_8512/g.21147 Transcript_8512/m.21147 type:complete len:208 (-) Transcript_8512:209-832(-)